MRPPVIRSQGGKASLIDEQYEKWTRFENFLNFAGKKELKDRLKELDPPPLSNYVDPSTIDSIRKARKDPASLVKKPGSGKDKTDHESKKENLEKNRQRIAKMKDMYNMFLKMEAEQRGESSPDTSNLPPAAA